MTSARAPGRSTVYRWGLVGTGLALAAAGLVLLALALSRQEAMATAAEALAPAAFGFGPLLQLLGGASLLFGAGGEVALPIFAPGLLWGGVALWLLGLATVGAGIRHVPRIEAPSPASGAPLHARLAGERDFTWGTLLAYGGGILVAELVVVLLQSLLSAGVQLTDEAVASGPFTLPPTGALAVSLLCGALVAFLAGSLGAWRSRRLAVPEATIGVFYLGTPIPIFLTLLGTVPALGQAFGFRLREVTYVAGLIGRPELGYWLVFAGLVLSLVLGITVGFVLAGSGRIESRMGYELFIARRQVEVFRIPFLTRIFAVLLFGILPPLAILAMVRAAEAAVERTRIRLLGRKDPLEAAEALHHLKVRERTPTGTMTALSVGGVGVGVMALIIVMSVMSGFEGDLQDKILGTNAHAVVHSHLGEIPDYEKVAAKIRTVRGVTGATPFIMNEVMVASDANVSGAVIKGIEPATVGDVTDLPANILPGGSLENLVHPEDILKRRINKDGKGALDERPADAARAAQQAARAAQDAASKALVGPGSSLPGSLVDDEFIQLQEPTPEVKSAVLPGILLGRELASSLRVVVGDRVNVVSPLGGELGPQGPMPKGMAFRVAGIFQSGMYEYDSKMVYILLSEAQRFFKVRGALGIELKVADVDDARRISKRVVSVLEGYPYRAKDWGEMNQNLFSALRLEKLVMALILSIISIVAAGLIVATVIMLVLEKRKEIAVLKALGVPDGGILKIFLAEGLQIGVAGGLMGLVAGLSWCLFIVKVGIQLDPDIYYISSLPVRIEGAQTVLAVVVAILVTFFASIYPALQASRLEPVEGLKAE